MRILIADDHALVLDMISMFLKSENDIEVDVSADVVSSLELIRKQGAYDLILLDYDMPGMNRLDGLEAVIKENESKPVAIMSGVAPRDIVQSSLDAGAAGYIPKTMSAKSLVSAVRFLAAGERYVPVSFMTEEPNKEQHPLEAKLTERELQVLEALCRGQTNKEIARELGLQEVTIKLHVKTLCRKLDAKNRTHAAIIAKETGLF